jgi:hypothetical protein
MDWHFHARQRLNEADQRGQNRRLNVDAQVEWPFFVSPSGDAG